MRQPDNLGPNEAQKLGEMASGVWRIWSATASWLERVDPGTHRRVKGLRLVTAYAIAAMAGLLPALTHGRPGGAALSQLAAGFALWASVSEGETTRTRSTRDLAALCFAAALGATLTATLTPLLNGARRPGPELILVTGSFLVGYLILLRHEVPPGLPPEKWSSLMYGFAP